MRVAPLPDTDFAKNEVPPMDSEVRSPARRVRSGSHKTDPLDQGLRSRSGARDCSTSLRRASR
jgi:hypothetical protein